MSLQVYIVLPISGRIRKSGNFHTDMSHNLSNLFSLIFVSIQIVLYCTFPDSSKNDKIFKLIPNTQRLKMANQDVFCSSCKLKVTNVDGTSVFSCPNCGKTEIVRCKQCRKIAAKYTCSECGFIGPN